MCWSKLKGLFHPKIETSPPELEPAQTQVTKRDERWLERHPTRKLVSTSCGGPNAPKRQPCPLGHGQKKRVGKAIGGALYYCNMCKAQFLVPYSKRNRGAF